MNIIIPMAGMGKRMRPHTLTTPKPLIPVAGKSIVQHLVEEIGKVVQEDIEEIGFVIGDFGKETEEKLLKIAANIGAKGKIYYQKEPLGTAHAILCAADSLKDKVVVAYADTLFKADFSMDDSKDGIIWVKKVDNPSSFGVVELSEGGSIIAFHEKPEHFISDMAIIGIYYFKDGAYLKSELQHLIDEGVKTGGEYGITDALQNMMNKGTAFFVDPVTEWLDCGNKDATVHTNQRVLEYLKDEELISVELQLDNSTIIKPCYIGPGVRIANSVVGPYVSIGEGTVVENCIIRNSIIQEHSLLTNINLDNSMIGSHVTIRKTPEDLSIGDYNTLL